MRIVAVELIHTFAKEHVDARSFLQIWVNEIERANWSHPSEIKERFATASLLSGNRVVCNIKGSRYRLLT